MRSIANFGGHMLRLLSFSGRATRSEWWAINLVFLVPVALLGKAITRDPYLGDVARAIMLLVAIALLWVSIAGSVRRLHDRNKQGSWYLISLIPVIGPVWLLIECGFLQGTVGANDYGMRTKSRFDLPR